MGKYIQGCRNDFSRGPKSLNVEFLKCAVTIKVSAIHKVSATPLKRLFKADYYCQTIEDFAREKDLEAIWQ